MPYTPELKELIKKVEETRPERVARKQRGEEVPFLDLDQRYRLDPEDGERVYGVSQPVTISQGCNRRCTYCIIPFRRGAERSRQPSDVRREVELLTRRGTNVVPVIFRISSFFS